MGVMGRGIAGSLLVLTLTGCGQAVGTTAAEPIGGSSTGQLAPPASPGGVTSDDACPAQEPSHLPNGLEDVTDAYLCVEEDRAVPGEGVVLFQVVRRVTGGLDALLTAFAAPDDAHEPDKACAAIGSAPLVVYLRDISGTHAVRAPMTSCNAPTEPARSAYTSLTTQVIGEQRDRTIQSQLSVDSNCSDDYKDMLSIDEELDSASPQEQAPPGSATTPRQLFGPVSVCTYRIATDDQGTRVGHLEASHTLTAEQLAAVNEALGRARPDPSCSRHDHTEFALLNGDQQDATFIALDGCAVSQYEGWWRADDQLRLAVGA